jgi:hypothetical protein
MTFRFRRRLQIIPGVSLNLGKTGASLSLGVRGAHVTLGRKGTRTTVGVPGTGMSWTNYQPHQQSKAAPAPTPPAEDLYQTFESVYERMNKESDLLSQQREKLISNIGTDQVDSDLEEYDKTFERFDQLSSQFLELSERIEKESTTTIQTQSDKASPALKFGLFLAVVVLFFALVGVFATRPDAPTTGTATVKQEASPAQQVPSAQQVTAKAPKPHSAETPLCRGRMTRDGCQP